MTRHPAASVDFDHLIRELEARIEKGFVRKAIAPDDSDLVLYTYTDRATYDKGWDWCVELARGVVLRPSERRVVAYTFPKFFNFGERDAKLPDEPFEVFEKLDGSLGVLFHDGRRWRVTTKGSFASDQAKWAEKWIFENVVPERLDVGVTYLTEIVHDANRIVVRYPYQGLVLLAVYGPDGHEYERPGCEDVAKHLGLRICAHVTYESLEAIKEAVATFGPDREGFVIRFASGYRLKMKGAEYLRIHRLISQVTPLALWDIMQNGGDLESLRKEIPEEFLNDFDAIRALLTERFSGTVEEVEIEKEKWIGKSDKEVGLALASIGEEVRPHIFNARKGGEKWYDAPRSMRAIFKAFRPDGNVLAGYSASSSMARVNDDG